MNILSLRIFHVVICLLLLFTPQILFAQTVIDRVVATIDGEPILESEIVKFAKAKMQNKFEHLTDGEMRDFTQQYVADELLQREATALGVRVLDEEVTAYIDEIKRQNGVTDEQFNFLLQERGLSRELYQRQVKIDILKSRIVSRQIRSGITISQEQIERFLEENPSRKPAVGSVKLLQIFVPQDQPGVMEQIKAALSEGKTLAQAGGAYFTDVGIVDPDDLREELSSVIEKLEVGKQSEVIETSVGNYIIEVASRVNKDGKVDGAVAEDIRNELFEKEFQQKLDSYLTVDLPKKYLVEFKL